MTTAAKILSQTAYDVPGKIKITEYFFQVPRDWTEDTFGLETRDSMTLFGRAAQRINKPAAPTSEDFKKQPEVSWILYLHGGPGFGCPSPQNAYWVQTMLERGYQVLCLDHRGTGLSSPLTSSTLGLRGDDEVQAKYLRSFRADSIVKDCEAVRVALTQDLPEGMKKWSIIGQSFGGFCCITYLSFFPESVSEAFVFGGLPPLVHQPDEVYRRLFQKLIARNQAYYRKFPEDVKRIQQICRFLQSSGNTTVCDISQEGYLTARRFMSLGLHLGFHGGLDTIHDLVLRAASDLDLYGYMTRPTVSKITAQMPFDDAIIYAVLHEAEYCVGMASNWSAERIKQEHLELFNIPDNGGIRPIYFTGEMVFPWMLEDYGELKKIANQTRLVQQFNDWPALYDEEQLAENTVPVYAAVYMHDMYVDYELSMATASKIRNCKTFITNVMYHDAYRSKMDEVTKALFALRDDTID